MNDEGVYRTAPATPGLLMFYIYWGMHFGFFIIVGEIFYSAKQKYCWPEMSFTGSVFI